MTTPSERIWAECAHEPEASLPRSLPTAARSPQTLAGAAERLDGGEALRAVVAEFMDDLRFARGSSDVAQRIEGEPRAVDSRTDAYLAALAEHVATHHGVATPEWAYGRDRFLDHFWWPTRFPALRARTVVESPAAFRRRGIFIGATSLQRV